MPNFMKIRRGLNFFLVDLAWNDPFTAHVFIQLHKAVQPHTAIPRLARAPLGPWTARTYRCYAWEKQPGKQTTQVWLILIVKFDSLFMYLCSFVFLVKNQICYHGQQ